MFVSRVFSRLSRHVCRNYRTLSPQHLPSHNLISVSVSLLHLTINASPTPRALFFSTFESTKATEEVKASEISGQAEAAVQTNGSGTGSEVDFSGDGKDFVVEYFAKGLLDVVDNLRTMSFIGNDNFSNIDASKGLDKAVQLLQKLHECIVDAEKQIAEVVTKCDEFDPESEACGPDRDGSILELQNFAKNLADVANNLGSASMTAKSHFSNIDAFKKSNEALSILKTLLEAVDSTEKQLDGVFEKLGLEKFNSKQEPYNPDRHDAIVQFPVNAQPPGTIIAVLKAGYILHGRVFRKAQVASTREVTDQDRAADAMTPGMNDDYGASEESEPQTQRTG